MSMMRMTMSTTMIAIIIHSTINNPAVFAWTCTKVSMNKITRNVPTPPKKFRMNWSQRVDKVVKVIDGDGKMYSVEQSPADPKQVLFICLFF